MPPAKTALPTAGAWSRLEVESPEPIQVSQSDVQAASYRIGLAPGLEDYFVLQEVRTDLIPGLTSSERAELGATCSPCMQVLPMGWSWALFFCQAAVAACMEVSGSPVTSVVSDRSPPVVLSSGDVASAVYVDNFAAVSTDGGLATHAVERAREVLEGFGLGCHEVSEGSADCEITGLLF